MAAPAPVPVSCSWRACLAARCPEDVPVEWHVKKLGRPITTLFAVIAAAALVQAGSECVGGDTEGVLVLLALFVLTACGSLCCRFLRGRPRSFERVAFVVWACTAGLLAYLPAFLSDSSLRSRYMDTGEMLMLHLPVFFGMRLQLYSVVYLPLCVLHLFVAKSLITEKFGETYPLPVYVADIVNVSGSLAVALMQQSFLKCFCDMECNLVTEVQSSELLISMFCNATCNLAADRETVISCDRGFQSMVGRDMAGERFRDCIHEDVEEQARWDSALTNVHVNDEYVPVSLLHMRLRDGNNARLDADVYVVSKTRHLPKSDRPRDRSGYLIGVRMSERDMDYGMNFPPAELAEGLVCKEEQVVMPPSVGNATDMARFPSIGNTTDVATSMPESTSTGHIFKALDPGSNSRSDDVLKAIRKIGRTEHWHIEAHELTLLPDKELGRGSFGVVVYGIFHGMPVAVKVPRSADQIKRIKQLGNELHILRHLRHSNLVLLHGAVVDPLERSIALVLELVNGRDLNCFVSQEGGPSDVARYQVILGMCCALRYLHSRKPVVVHGDLKSDNVLIERTGSGVRPKLLDFGLSRLLTAGARPLGGTVKWMAPEVFNNPDLHPRPAADVFSFGRLVHFTATGLRPYVGLSTARIRDALKAQVLPTPQWPSRASEYRALVELCLEVVPHLRPSMQHAYNVIVCLKHNYVMDEHGISVSTLHGARGWQEGLQQLSLRPEGQGLAAARACTRAGGVGHDCGGVRRAAPARLALPYLIETTMRAKVFTVLQTLSRWYCDTADEACCDLHVRLKDLRQVCLILQRQGCAAGFHLPAFSSQCSTCGLLIDCDGDITVCELCTPTSAASILSLSGAAASIPSLTGAVPSALMSL